MPSGRSAYKNTNALRFLKYTPREAVVPHVAALSPLSSSGSKSDDRRDDRPAASSPEPADMSRRLWPHPGPVRLTRAAILTTDRLAATTAAATAAQPRAKTSAATINRLRLLKNISLRLPQSCSAHQAMLERGSISLPWWWLAWV